MILSIINNIILGNEGAKYKKILLDLTKIWNDEN